MSEREYSRAGNYYIMESTWLRAPDVPGRGRGVVADITKHDADSPREGSVKILWFPNTIAHLSTMSFRHDLRTGALVVDDRQHPYDKVDWETAEQGGERL